MEWRESLRRESDACLSRLIATDSDFSLDAEQPSYRGGTHYVTFGSHRGRPAVFKYFVAAHRWENEAACLAHFQDSGLVPKVFYQEPGSLIVMERLRGADVLNALSALTLSSDETGALSREVGAALGRLATTGPPESTGAYNPLTDFPDWGWNLGLSNVVGRCLSDGGRIVKATDSRHSETLESSLQRIEEQFPAVQSEPLILFHEDVSNLRVEGIRFVAFYDLELCRGGALSMQLGAALNLCREACLDWGHLVEGFEESSAIRLRRDDYRSILAMNHLSRWIRISQHCRRNGESKDDESLAFAVAEAESHADEMIITERVIQAYF